MWKSLSRYGIGFAVALTALVGVSQATGKVADAGKCRAPIHTRVVKQSARAVVFKSYKAPHFADERAFRYYGCLKSVGKNVKFPSNDNDIDWEYVTHYRLTGNRAIVTTDWRYAEADEEASGISRYELNLKSGKQKTLKSECKLGCSTS